MERSQIKVWFKQTQAQAYHVEFNRHINLFIFKHSKVSRQGPALLLYFVTQKEKKYFYIHFPLFSKTSKSALVLSSDNILLYD